MKRIWIAYLNTDELPVGLGSSSVTHVISADLPDADLGANTLILRTRAVIAQKVLVADATHDLDPHCPYFEDRLLEAEQRQARSTFRAKINSLSGSKLTENMAVVVIAVDVGGRLRFYHHTETTEREMVALFVAETAAPPYRANTLAWFNQALDSLRPDFEAKAPLLGTRQAYLQWRPDMELERKFTFHKIPDIWALEATLFAELYEGCYPGFYPEPHMGIQIFDYENHLFEIFSPIAEQGYISFIPQVDNRVTVKRKWFESNAELRREMLWPGQELDVGKLDVAARSRVDGELQALPAFRRKRLDVNYESLETGHVFGVYFDICTTVDAVVPHRFGQVEVEYCRTRSSQPLVNVMPEFEALASYVHDFLTRHGVDFQLDLYSKLDFARDSAARQVA